jgi:DNA-binding beta-propeller fold protein YncE
VGIFAGRVRRLGTTRLPEPVCVLPTPGSFLESPAARGARPFFVGRRPRLATCGGVAWFHGRRLATLSLLGNAVHTYEVDAASGRATPLQALGDPAGLSRPENLAFSHAGDVLAVTNSGDDRVTLYAVDAATHEVLPRPVASIACGAGANPHGVAFSPDDAWLLVTTVEPPGSLRCFRLSRPAGRVEATETWRAPNPRSPLRPKGVSFVPGGRRVALAYGPNALVRPHRAPRGLVALAAFDPARGTLGPETAVLGGRAGGLRCPEDVAAAPDGTALVVVDQASDRIVRVALDADSDRLGPAAAFRGEASRLSFPHGAAISSDGALLAVACYGSDEATVFALADLRE